MFTKTFAVHIESATRRVVRFVPGVDVEIPGVLEAGETGYSCSEQDFNDYQTFFTSNIKNQIDYFRDTNGTFYSQTWPENPAIIDKTTMTANGVDTVHITLLPNPTTVTVQGIEGSFNIIDGTFEFTYDSPATFTVVCKSNRHIDKSFSITAT
jgi:hypothetical protein